MQLSIISRICWCEAYGQGLTTATIQNGARRGCISEAAGDVGRGIELGAAQRRAIDNVRRVAPR